MRSKSIVKIRETHSAQHYHIHTYPVLGEKTWMQQLKNSAIPKGIASELLSAPAPPPALPGPANWSGRFLDRCFPPGIWTGVVHPVCGQKLSIRFFWAGAAHPVSGQALVFLDNGLSNRFDGRVDRVQRCTGEESLPIRDSVDRLPKRISLPSRSNRHIPALH
ncbi:hypothetical protein PtA15_3A29 [Puccinia triticina]|uniref:Uncharacterized protein n=1 Tax=Puccinia triticina TaxID=208348 RepID=A0ABY7CBS7_9BASI|nr:uncharacterized protein PtA15_3A29 [Puccinia triticina]WAQ82666.1 hypothetical protein PtA15_3A29 [Puccinia triticina]